MPKALEKIKNDILKGNKNMSESMAYALATNILKKRKAAGTTRNKTSVAKSAAYKSFEKTEPKDVEATESYAEKASEYKRGMQ